MIPDDLSRELCNWLTDWCVGEPTHYITANEAQEIVGYLSHPIAKHIEAAYREGLRDGKQLD